MLRSAHAAAATAAVLLAAAPGQRADASPAQPRNGTDVAVTVGMSPNPVLVGQIYVATFRIANRGPRPATVRMTAGIGGTDATGRPLPIGGTRVEWGSELRCSGSAGRFACSLGTLRARTSTSVTIRFRALASGTRTGRATVTSSLRDPRPGNNRSSRTILVVAGPGSQENPIPRGTTATLQDGWQLTVVSVIPDATALVLATNTFNDPPRPGYQFFIARLRATYPLLGSSRLDASFRFRALGPAAVSYSTFSDSCGVIPDRINDAEVFTGGTLEGNVCWEVRTSDAGNLVMYDDPVGGDDTRRLWFRLTP